MNLYKIKTSEGIQEIIGNKCIFSIKGFNIFANTIYTYKDIDYTKDFEIFAFIEDDISNHYSLVYEYKVNEKAIVLTRIDLTSEMPLTKSKAFELCSEMIELGSLHNFNEVKKEILKLQGKYELL